MGKKDIIVKAAAKIIAEEGFYNTKMQNIADEAEIAVGTIYNYFNSKEDILDYIFIYERSKRIEILERSIVSKEPFRVLLEEYITLHINRVKNNPDVAKVLVQEELSPLIYRSELLKDSFARIKRAMELFIIKGQQQEEINKEYDAKFVANIIFCTLRSLTSAIFDKTCDMDLETAKKQVITYIINGLR